MTARSHLTKYPKARASTVAYLIKRDEMTEKLRREIKARQSAFERVKAAIRRALR